MTAFYAEFALEQKPAPPKCYFDFGFGHVFLTSGEEATQASLALFMPGQSLATRQMDIDFPWQTGRRYKFYVTRVTRDGQTACSAYVGLADQDTWVHIGQVSVPGIHYLKAPVGVVSSVAANFGGRSGAAAFGQVWVRTREYGWQPTHVMTSQSGSLKTRAEVHQTNMIRVHVDANRQSKTPNHATFEFDRTADSFPVMPE